jgi:hypothetical protein
MPPMRLRPDRIETLFGLYRSQVLGSVQRADSFMESKNLRAAVRGLARSAAGHVTASEVDALVGWAGPSGYVAARDSSSAD